MRIVVRLVFGIVAGLLLLVFNLESSNAQVPPSVGLKPSSGPAGSSFTISWNGFYTCRIINFFWDGALLTSQIAPNASGSIGAKVPADAKPGPYPVTATCTSQKETATGTFTVTGVTTTTPVTPTTVPITPVKKPSVPVTTPTRPVTTTTTPPTTTTTPPSTTDTPPPTSTTSTEPGPGDLVLDRPNIQPGDKLSATGKGCEPWHAVTLTADGDEVGTGMADSTGKFTAPVEFTRIEAGRHTVVADCGIRLTGAVDQTVTSSSGGHTGTLIVLVFFVLAGITVLRFP
jgi:hypothetical protein